jgi:putrescine transport system substrate-binding protein
MKVGGKGVDIRRFILFVLLFSAVSVLFYLPVEKQDQFVNVYGWYGIIPQDVIEDFEKEFGIKVRYDFYDNNEVLEAKLLVTRSGYDVVFPSFIPYGSRQLSLGIYRKLDLDKIPNLKNMTGEICSKFAEITSASDKLIPFYWGTIGIAYNYDLVKELIPIEKMNSYDVIFDEKFISKLSRYGVTFPEEFTDIYHWIASYTKIGSNANKDSILKNMHYIFKKIRPYIKKFSSTTLIQDLFMGNVCLAISSSDNAWRAIEAGKDVGRKIIFFIPKEGGCCWVDCIGIPCDAPNSENAYKFINYLLRKRVASRITEHSGILTSVCSIDDVSTKITSCKDIYPDPETMKNLSIGKPTFTKQDLEQQREFDKAWFAIRTQDFTNFQAFQR